MNQESELSPRRHLKAAASTGVESSSDVEQRIEAIAGEYLDRLQAGAAPDRQALVAAHLDLAELLEERLRDMELVHRLAAEAGPETLSFGSPDTDPPAATEGRRTREAPVDQLGRYRIDRVAGRGAFATVYRAWDTKFDRQVALKVLHPSELDRGARRRLRAEAASVARLRHPNIVPLHDEGVIEDWHYLDMAWVDGETLEARLRQGPLSTRQAAEFCLRLAGALHYAHEQGVVHRDVKPSNVLIDVNGQPQLTDFGLARRVDAEMSISGPGQVLGTPAYMSPEQAAGRGREADGRADVFSLGVVLYRMFSGRFPFGHGDSATEILHAVIHDEPSRQTLAQSGIPRDLGLICLKALEKDPDDRFESAGALADELRRWLNDEQVLIRPPTVWERVVRWSRRNRLAARIAAASLAMLLVLGSTLGALAWQIKTRAVLEAGTRAELQIMALDSLAADRLQHPTSGRRVDSQEILCKTAKLRHDVPADRIERVDLKLRSTFASTLSVPELKEVEHTLLWTSDWVAWRSALHPNGNVLMIGTDRGPIKYELGKELRLRAEVDPDLRPRLWYSPDGRYLAFAPVEGGLELWDEDATRVVMELKHLGPNQESQALAVHFESDGKLRTCWDDGTVARTSIPEGAELEPWRVENRPGAHLTAAAFDAEGRLMVGDASGGIRLFEADGPLIRDLTPASSRIEALAWSADGQLVATGSMDGCLDVWQLSGKTLRQFVVGGTGVSQAQFHPNGNWVLAGTREGGCKMWDLATGELLLAGGHTVAPAGITGDGRRLGGCSYERAGFFDLLTPETVRPLSGLRTRAARLVWDPDSRFLVALDNRFEIAVWDVVRGVLVTRLSRPSDRGYAENATAALSGDHQYLASAGGDEAVVCEFPTGAIAGRWLFPVSAVDNRLAPAAPGKFLLVREEFDTGSTVVYELEVGHEQPKNLRILRTAKENEKGHLRSELTSDGRWHLWVGPVVPFEKRRVEVYEVATGRLVTRVPMPTSKRTPEPGANLSDDGRWLATSLEEGDARLYDLREQTPSQRVPIRPEAFAPDFGLLAFKSGPAQERTENVLSLQSWPKNVTWLEFTSGDHTDLRPLAFSPDGRYFAWGANEDGLVLVADLPALKLEISGFEQRLAQP